jgi:hypothetical protein
MIVTEKEFQELSEKLVGLSSLQSRVAAYRQLRVDIEDDVDALCKLADYDSGDYSSARVVLVARYSHDENFEFSLEDTAGVEIVRQALKEIITKRIEARKKELESL